MPMDLAKPIDTLKSHARPREPSLPSQPMAAAYLAAHHALLGSRQTAGEAARTLPGSLTGAFCRYISCLRSMIRPYMAT